MTITVNADLDVLSQEEFRPIAYEVMKEIFALHNDVGRFFDERVYQQALKSRQEKSLIAELVRDWGTCLDRSLYEEALVHFLGGPERAYGETDVYVDGKIVASQTVGLCSPQTAFKVTTMGDESDSFREHLIRFLSHTSLECMQWIDISRQRIRFETLV